MNIVYKISKYVSRLKIKFCNITIITELSHCFQAHMHANMHTSVNKIYRV